MWQWPDEPPSSLQALTSRVKMPTTGLWSLTPYSMLQLYTSCATFRGYSSSSSTNDAVEDPSSSSSATLGLIRQRMRSVQAGFLFFPLPRGERKTGIRVIPQLLVLRAAEPTEVGLGIFLYSNYLYTIRSCYPFYQLTF